MSKTQKLHVAQTAPYLQRLETGDPCYDVLVALRRIIRAVDLQSKRVSKESGLTLPQVLILQSIQGLGEVTTGRISEEVNLSQATVTTILDRLEQRQLIERYRSTKDRRIVHARLTLGGKLALKKAPTLLHEEFIEAFLGYDEKNQKRILESLKEVARMLGVGELDAAPILDIRPPTATEK
ncbi:MAG: MarR family transcriptional regulator [Rhodospirillaceae bacterium]|nr:MarR family transcriptional regulator [Rhodospirillaceae bacterium]